MLLEVTPEEADVIIPVVPTRLQYATYWKDTLQSTGRIVTAVFVGISLLLASRLFIDNTFFGLLFGLSGFLSLFYPFLWGPLWTISRRQLAFRELPYTGLFFGKVLRTRRITAVIQEREKVDENGDLYMEEIRERQFEMEIGDNRGRTYRIRAKDDPRYKAIVRNQSVIGLIKSYSRDLERKSTLSEVYIVKLAEWVGDLAYLDREKFLELANELLDQEGSEA